MLQGSIYEINMSLKDSGNFIPRRLVFTSPATALSLDNAKIAVTISGELLVNIAMQSFLTTPWLSRYAANLTTSILRLNSKLVKGSFQSLTSL